MHAADHAADHDASYDASYDAADDAAHHSSRPPTTPPTTPPECVKKGARHRPLPPPIATLLPRPLGRRVGPAGGTGAGGPGRTSPATRSTCRHLGQPRHRNRPRPHLLSRLHRSRPTPVRRIPTPVEVGNVTAVAPTIPFGVSLGATALVSPLQPWRAPVRLFVWVPRWHNF